MQPAGEGFPLLLFSSGGDDDGGGAATRRQRWERRRDGRSEITPERGEGHFLATSVEKIKKK